MSGMDYDVTLPPPAAPRLKQPAAGTTIARTQLRGCAVERCQCETYGMVVCVGHFKLLPSRLRTPLWAEYHEAYRRGVEPADFNDYKDALRHCVRWLEENTEIPS